MPVSSAAMLPQRLRDLVAFMVGVRTLQHALVLLSLILLPSIFHEANYRENFHWPANAPPRVSNAFMTWDAQHYLYLSQHAYEPGHPSVALYPLWPWLIAAATPLFGGARLAAALVLAAGLSVVAAVLLRRMAARKLGDGAADTALALFLVQPAAFFFGLPYAESLFLVLCLVVVDRLESGHLLAAGAVGFFVPLVRPPGAFIVFPIAVAALLAWRADRRWRWSYLVAVALPLLGVVAHAALLYWKTGDPFASTTIQAQYVGRGSLARLLDPVTVLREFLDFGPHHEFRRSPLDRAFFALFVASLPAILVRLGPVHFAFALPMGLVTGIAQGGFTCFLRYLAVVFPAFLVWGQLLNHPRAAALRPLLLGGLLALQVMLAILHANNYWVA